MNSDEDKCSNTNDLSNNSSEYLLFLIYRFYNISVDQVIASANKSSLEKSFDSDNEDGFDSVPSKKSQDKFFSSIVR